MPDKRKHRGPNFQDPSLFHTDNLPVLRQAVSDFSWLLSRSYAPDSALKLVGDRHGLTARQRMAVQRSACSDEALARRTASCVTPAACADAPLGIDGYNLLITLESAASGAPLFVGRDGALRDLGGVHGTYRTVQETASMTRLIIQYASSFQVARVDWLLDRPISNSGRLKTLIAENLEHFASRLTLPVASWNIELVDSPDQRLIDFDGIVVTSDSGILDRCGRWINLGRQIVVESLPEAWIVDLSAADPTQ